MLVGSNGSPVGSIALDPGAPEGDRQLGGDEADALGQVMLGIGPLDGLQRALEVVERGQQLLGELAAPA